jgi:hypothetical protein
MPDLQEHLYTCKTRMRHAHMQKDSYTISRCKRLVYDMPICNDICIHVPRCTNTSPDASHAHMLKRHVKTCKRACHGTRLWPKHLHCRREKKQKQSPCICVAWCCLSDEPTPFITPRDAPRLQPLFLTTFCFLQRTHGQSTSDIPFAQSWRPPSRSPIPVCRHINPPPFIIISFTL